MKFILTLLGGMSFFLVVHTGAGALFGNEQLGLIAYKQAIAFFFGFWFAWIVRPL